MNLSTRKKDLLKNTTKCHLLSTPEREQLQLQSPSYLLLSEIGQGY